MLSPAFNRIHSHWWTMVWKTSEHTVFIPLLSSFVSFLTLIQTMIMKIYHCDEPPPQCTMSKQRMSVSSPNPQGWWLKLKQYEISPKCLYLPSCKCHWLSLSCVAYNWPKMYHTHRCETRPHRWILDFQNSTWKHPSLDALCLVNAHTFPTSHHQFVRKAFG